MSYLIKPIVILLLSALCMSFIKGFGGYMKRRRLESRELLHLCEVIRKSIATRLLTPKEALSGVSGLSAVPARLAELVVSGATLDEAFSAVSKSLSVSPRCREMLSEYFATFGKGYLEDEIRCADEFIERYRSELQREEMTGDTDERVVKSVIIAITLGVIILII